MKPFLFTTLFFAMFSTSIYAGEKHLFENYSYSIKQSGINYRFVFSDNISDPELKKQAGIAVLETLYNDSSLQPKTAKTYKKERAQCYAINSRFYTYTLCFLPNEFTQKKPVLQGFVTRVPNGLWLLTHILLPAIFVFAGLFYGFRHKPNKTARGIA